MEKAKKSQKRLRAAQELNRVVAEFYLEGHEAKAQGLVTSTSPWGAWLTKTTTRLAGGVMRSTANRKCEIFI